MYVKITRFICKDYTKELLMSHFLINTSANSILFKITYYYYSKLL